MDEKEGAVTKVTVPSLVAKLEAKEEEGDAEAPPNTEVAAQLSPASWSD